MQVGTDRSIALIGYRGSGKTTVARIVAARLHLPLVDTDELVVQKVGMSIRQIFSQQGEERFREMERQAVATATAGPPSILSVGGGAVLDRRNVAALRSSATVVWLTAPINVLIERVRQDPQSGDSRPALTDRPPREEVERVLNERLPLYKQAADHTIDTSNRMAEEIAEAIISLLFD